MSKKIKLFIGGICLFFSVIIVPIIINECYKCKAPLYITKWEAADVLSFYGTILAASGAALGVFCTVRFSQRQYQEDKRHGVLPYLAVDILKRTCLNPCENSPIQELNHTMSVLMANDAKKYCEFKYDKFYFIVQDQKIKRKTELSIEEEKAIQYKLAITKSSECGQILEDRYCYIPHEIRNTGKGCAIDLRASLSLENTQLTASTIPIQLYIGETLYIGILLDSHQSPTGKYTFKLSYEDILGYRYVQSKTISIKKDRCGLSASEPTEMKQIQL